LAFLSSRQMARLLAHAGSAVNRKRVQRLMPYGHRGTGPKNQPARPELLTSQDLENRPRKNRQRIEFYYTRLLTIFCVHPVMAGRCCCSCNLSGLGECMRDWLPIRYWIAVRFIK
jgi:hypothetical protein